MAALRRIDAAIQSLQRRREEEEPVAGWGRRTVERGPLVSGEKNRGEVHQSLVLWVRELVPNVFFGEISWAVCWALLGCLGWVALFIIFFCF